MKKFIYSDMDTIRSVSAQLYQGIILEEESIMKGEQLEVNEVMSKPISMIFELFLAEFLKIEKGEEYRIIHPLSIETI